MIEVYAKHGDGRYRLYVTGHAEGTERDIVCAGVSALVESLVLFAAETPECRHLRTHVESGRVFLACRGGLGRAFDAVLRGLMHISRIYPPHVQVFEQLTTNRKKRGIITPSAEMPADTSEK